jgi:hypothetical protein
MMEGDSSGVRCYESKIDEELCTVHVVRQGKTWTAYGSFRSKRLEGKGRTESEALSNWNRLANFEANA